jgi:hypothetical protein
MLRAEFNCNSFGFDWTSTLVKFTLKFIHFFKEENQLCYVNISTSHGTYTSLWYIELIFKNYRLYDYAKIYKDN